jgi:NMD protein affecting ribosome stability and mRNA decay
MHIPLDLFDCGNCGATLRSRQVHRGAGCTCPYCGRHQNIPGRMGLLGKCFILLSHGLEGMPHSFCPYCFSESPTYAAVCHRCTRDLPPLVG